MKAEEKIEQFIDSLNADEQAVLHRMMSVGASSSPVKAALFKFLNGLDTNDRANLSAIGMAAFELYATSFPGPDTLAKNTARPHVKTAVDNLVIDVCSWS